MKNLLYFTLFSTSFIGTSAIAQRYLEPIFTEDQLEITSDVVYAQNIDFMTSDFAGANTFNDLFLLSDLADNGTPFPAEFFDLADPATDVKLKNIRMDVYRPSDQFDTETARPVIIHLHTGNFLPPPLNGSVNGLKTDSIAIHLCTEWAKRGYVAVSMEYRLGWNPLHPSLQERRGTLLNAVYRALHDMKWCIRFMRENAEGANIYGINPDQIACFGSGSGGYVVQAAATLDQDAELFLEQFLPNPFDPTTSYVNTLEVGTIDGIGYPNSLNLYRDNGVSAEFHMGINLGGALADESWLEEGDAPMVAINCVRDDFAPFTAGTVIVPTTQEEVVDVHGPNFFIKKANDLGNNDVFAGIPDGDPFTDRARDLYGTTWSVSNGGSETINPSPEGLFPVIRPQYPFLSSDSSPWQWWDPQSPLAQTVIAPPNITAHMASMATNPFMSVAQGHAYCDTINGYVLPRIMCAFFLPQNWCGGNPEVPNDLCDNAADINEHFGTNGISVTDPYSNVGATSIGDPSTGWDCFGDDGGASLENSVWFTFEGDGSTYNIRTVDCGLGSDYVTNGNTQMAIYAGTDCSDLTPVLCNENGPGSTASNEFSEVQFATVDGVTYYILIDGFNEGGDAASGGFCIRVEDLGVGVEEIIRNGGVAVYPNPANEIVTITAADQVLGASIFGITGNLIKQVTGQSNTTLSLDISDLPTGVYFLNVNLPSGLVSKKVVKN